MFEELKTIGSIVGLLTGLFVLYDRYAKGRPIASLTIVMNGSRNLACIRVSNITPYDFAITDTEVSPKTYFLTEDLEINRLVRGAAGRSPYFMLKSGASKELVIAPMFKDGLPLEVNHHMINFRIYWRRGNATWLPQLPVVVRTSTSTIRKYALQEEDRV
jgi:hypothetical protein